MNIYDLHTHSKFSDGQATIEDLISAAHKKSYTLGVSDHLFCCGMDTVKNVETYIENLNHYNVLKGLEANIGEDYTLPEKLSSKIDYIIASVHSVPDIDGNPIILSKYFSHRSGHTSIYNKNYDDSFSRFYLEESYKLVEKTMKTQRFDIYGHCTVTPFYEDLIGTNFLTDWENDILMLCKKYNKAIEISGLWKEPSLSFINRAKDLGLKFSFGSDCHRMNELCNLDYVEEMIAEAGLTESDLFIPH